MTLEERKAIVDQLRLCAQLAQTGDPQDQLIAEMLLVGAKAIESGDSLFVGEILRCWACGVMPEVRQQIRRANWN